MIPSWLANAAAILILWFALAVTLGPFIGAWLKRCTPMPPAPGDPCPPDEVPAPGLNEETQP
jgi:hypothetical protein